MKTEKDVTEYFEWLKEYLEEKKKENKEDEIEWVWFEK